MGLSVTLSNALSGMKTTQDGLTVVSRNVANAGNANYHRQSVVTKDMNGGSSTYSSFVGIQRAFTASLERAHIREISDTGYADVRSTFLQRLEVAFGKPGAANSLDTLLQNFSSSLEALAASPEDYSTRATTVTRAQDLANALNSLSGTVQDLRQETETQMGAEVDTLNQSLQALQGINNRLSDQSLGDSARLAVLDERDRLVGQISDIIDTQVVYRPDDSVALMTKSGLGLLDLGATTFRFTPAGSVSANALYDINDTKNGVGVITAYTPSGLTIDVIDQKIIQSGRLSALVDMRDEVLPQAQAQLDTIAAALTEAFNTNSTSEADTAVAGPPAGHDFDTSALASGNDISFTYTQNGQSQAVRVVKVEDGSKLPMDYVTATGERVIGLRFDPDATAAASQLNTMLGTAVDVSATGTTLSIRDGANGTINSAVMRTTSTNPQDGTLGLNLFTDPSSPPFTNSLDGIPQIRGYAARISVSSEVLGDNSLLVKASSSTSLGDPSRINHFLDGLHGKSYSSDYRQMPELGGYSLSGNVQGLINQTINYQGDQIAGAKDALDVQQVALDSIEQRVNEEYGVNVDEEMARLMELQNTYAASARVVSVAQQLIDSLLQI